MRGERKDRERNSGWERVRTRREKRESNKERAREGQCLQFAGNSRGHKQDYTRVNWRDHKDVASFYFTRFPEDTTEEALWQHFKKAGDVREVFIAKKRNKNGRRYGFVRFKGVEDLQQLEKLDNIVFGGLKMFVNIPKFGRAVQGKPQPVTWGCPYTKSNEEESRDTNLRVQQRGYLGKKSGSYAEVVKKENTGADQRRPADKRELSGHWSQSEVHLDISLTEHKWLTEARVGRLKNLSLFDKVEDDILWDLGANVSPRYIGDDMILLLGLTDD